MSCSLFYQNCVFHVNCVTYICRFCRFTYGVYTRFKCCVSSELFLAQLETNYRNKGWPGICSFQNLNLIHCSLFYVATVHNICCILLYFRWSHCSLIQMEPYLRGDVSPMMDKSCDVIELDLRISKLRESMCNLHSLQMKLRV